MKEKYNLIENNENIVWHQYNKGRKDREKLLNQKSFVVWMTGLSGSGKSTIASVLEKKLYERQKLTYILDGDNIRHGLNSDLQFSVEDRKENLRRIGELARILIDAGLITICAFVSPFEEDRKMIRKKIEDDFIEVYIKAEIETCKKRDPKKLYKKALRGEIKEFTGLGSSYEEPSSPEVTIETESVQPEEAAEMIIGYLEKRRLI